MSKYCSRSHPHEHMDCCCIHKSEIAKWQNAFEHADCRIKELETKISILNGENSATYKVAGIRYSTKNGVFFTENQNEVWNSKDEIMSWDFLFEAVLSSKFDDSVSLLGSNEPK